MRTAFRLSPVSLPFAAAFLTLAVLTASAPGQSFQDVLGTKPGRSAGKKQPADVSVTLTPGKASGTVVLAVTAKVPEDSWIYSMHSSPGTETRIDLKELTGLDEPERDFVADHEPKREFVQEFNDDVEKFFDSVTWQQTLTARPGASEVAVKGVMRYQVCNKESCKNGKAEIDVRLVLPTTTPPAPAARSGEVETIELPAPTGNDQQYEQKWLEQGKPNLAGTWKVGIDRAVVRAGETVRVVVLADLLPGWHFYGFDQGRTADGQGPSPTVIRVTGTAGLVPLDPAFTGAVPHEQDSDAWPGLVEKFWEGSQMFLQRFQVPSNVAPGELELKGTVAWQLCRQGRCLLDAGFEFRVPVTVVAEEASGRVESRLAQLTPLSSPNASEAIEALSQRQLQPPVAARETPAEAPSAEAVSVPAAQAVAEPQAAEVVVSRGIDKSQGLPLFLLAAAVAGFAALLTPCVFPMVPITVSFFQKQSEQQHHRPVLMALVYCLGIIGTFTLLGLLMSAFFGAASLNSLANNPWLNLFIAGVMIFFGLNLLGMFEISIPSWLLTYTSGQESRGGYLGVLFMALTFTLTSFTCTFAFAGGLLAAAAQGDRLWPILGLLVFSAAFSLPFFFLALFPSWLKKLPRAGGWMNVIKVIMGLLEMGAAFKFLSVADQYWHPTAWIFDYELVMSAWMVISITATAYLLGLFRLPHDVATEHIGVFRFFSAMSFLGLAAYIAVGLYGSQQPTSKIWEVIVAFAPPRFDGVNDSRFGPALGHGGVTYALDYRRALDYASKNGKPVLLDFTGVNCVNCRKMEQGPLASPQVQERLKDFICVQVYCDQVPVVTDPAERARLLDQNVALQEDWFGNTSLPAYAIVVPDPDLLSRQPGAGLIAEKIGYSPDSEEFAKFLDQGLAGWQKRANAPLIGKTESR